MTTRRLKGVAVFVLCLALLQVFFEDLVMFVATTDTGGPDWLSSPLFLAGVPLLLSVALIAVLLGGALFYADTLR